MKNALMMSAVVAIAASFMFCAIPASAQDATVELTITIGTITHIDEIDPGAPEVSDTDQFNEADWYYYVGVKEDGGSWVWQMSDVETESDIWTANAAHTFTLSSASAEVAITLCERDNFTATNPWEATGSDELADISVANGGGINNAAAAGEYVPAGPYPGASYMAIYDLSSNVLTGDNVTSSGSEFLTTGVGDDNTENDASLTFSISDGYEPPVADAGGDVTGAPGSEIAFSGAESKAGPTGEIVSYYWDFESDGVFDAEGMDVTNTFSQAGSYTVTLRVIDSLGGWSEDSIMTEISGESDSGTAGGDEATPGFGSLFAIAAMCVIGALLYKRR